MQNYVNTRRKEENKQLILSRQHEIFMTNVANQQHKREERLQREAIVQHEKMRAVEENKVKKLAVVMERKKREENMRKRESNKIEDNKDRYNDKMGGIINVTEGQDMRI